MKKDNRGGKRQGAGRKTILDKKKALRIYLLSSRIDSLILRYGKNELRKIIEDKTNQL